MVSRELACLRETGVEIILVSSGAVGAGMGKLKLNEVSQLHDICHSNG